MTTYSYSRIKTFESCKKSFFLQYVDKSEFIKLQNRPGQTGSDVHNILEVYVRHLMDNNIPEDLEFIQYLAETMTDAAGYGDVKHVLEFFSETHVWDNEPGTVLLEHPLAINEDLSPAEFDDPGAWYRGKLDRLFISEDGEYARITDYKTSRLLPTKSEWEFDKQVKSYLMLVAANMPDVKHIDVVFDYIRWNVKMQGSYDIGPTFAEDMSQVFRASIAEIEKTTKFPESPGSFCALCSAFHACPMVKGVYADAAISPVVDAIKDPIEAGKRVTALERVAKEIKSALKAIVDHKQPVVYDNDVWEYRLTAGAEVADTLEFINYLINEKGADEEDVYTAINLPKTSVMKIQKATDIKILNKDSTVVEEFETMVRPRFTARFGKYKRK